MSIAFIIAITGISGCRKNNDPIPPITEKTNELCTVTYNDKTYTLKITNAAQGMFSESFILPENISDTVYTFSGEGCEIKRGSLSVHTDRTYLSDNSLPKRLYDVFSMIQNTVETQYAGTDDSGENNVFVIGDHYIFSDKASGTIKSIETADGTFAVQFK